MNVPITPVCPLCEESSIVLKLTRSWNDNHFRGIMIQRAYKESLRQSQSGYEIDS